MPELGTPGSARGAGRKTRPYRDYACSGVLAGQTHELLTGVRRPAGDETGIEWRGATGGEVGFVLVHTSPRMSWTRGLSSTPDCATGRSPAPEHVS